MVFNKQVDEPVDPAQEKFKSEVRHYVNGRLWRSFTDPMSCNLAVLEALREVQVDDGPVERRARSGNVDIPWLPDIALTDERGFPILGSVAHGGGLLPSSVYSPVLELHLTPAESTLPSMRELAELARAMARTARELDFVSDGDQLLVGSGDGFASAVRPPELTSRAIVDGMTVEEFRGLVASRAGAIGAFKAMPADNMGTLVNLQTVQSDLAHLYPIAAAHLPKAEWVSVAAAIHNADRVYEGDPAQMGSRSRGFMRSTSNASVRVGSDFMVPGPQLSRAFGDIGADLAHDLLADLGRLR